MRRAAPCPVRRRSLRHAALIPLRLPAEIRAPFYRPSVALLRRPDSMQLARHGLRPSAAAGGGDHMRQRDEGPALLFRTLHALGLLLLMLDGGKARLPRRD